MRNSIILIFATVALTGCGQAADDGTANKVANAPKKEKTPYCFFKDADTKAWSAATDKDGNVVVKGQAYRSDSRYKAILGKPKVEGAVAEVWPTIVTNDAGYGAFDDWWDVKLTIPGSAAVQTVRVRCGKKVFAELTVARQA
jgi:hypothetical protein